MDPVDAKVTPDPGMFLDVNELAVRKLRIRKSYAPGTVDLRSSDFRQAEPLEVRATAELIEGQIRVYGHMHTRLEFTCARCLEPVVEEVSKDFDLFYRPAEKPNPNHGEVHLTEEDVDIGFFQGNGMFLADVLVEQVNLLVPMKAICRSDCRGLCSHCGANLNHEECRCEAKSVDQRFAPLARLKQDWTKKQ